MCGRRRPLAHPVRTSADALPVRNALSSDRFFSQMRSHCADRQHVVVGGLAASTATAHPSQAAALRVIRASVRRRDCAFFTRDAKLPAVLCPCRRRGSVDVARAWRVE